MTTKSLKQNLAPYSIPCCGPVPTPPRGQSWEALMDRAIEHARHGAAAGEVPVGALLVHPDGRILAETHNQPVGSHDPTAHAEILALRQAGARLGNYRLEECVLVVTLEPCLMCTGALVHARLGGLVFGAADAKAGAIISCLDGLAQSFHNHQLWYMGGIRSRQCTELLQRFFAHHR
ncbi:MAG: tRNA adenosine(34) deaminase TadA [Desulfovibrionaceae bacterium]